MKSSVKTNCVASPLGKNHYTVFELNSIEHCNIIIQEAFKELLRGISFNMHRWRCMYNDSKVLQHNATVSTHLLPLRKQFRYPRYHNPDVYRYS